MKYEVMSYVYGCVGVFFLALFYKYSCVLLMYFYEGIRLNEAMVLLWL